MTRSLSLKRPSTSIVVRVAANAKVNGDMLGEPSEYELRMFTFDNQIFVAIYYLDILEYVVPVDGFVDWLERSDEKWFFVEPPKIERSEKDNNPDFVTGIPAIDKAIIRIRSSK